MFIKSNNVFLQLISIRQSADRSDGDKRASEQKRAKSCKRLRLTIARMEPVYTVLSLHWMASSVIVITCQFLLLAKKLFSFISISKCETCRFMHIVCVCAGISVLRITQFVPFTVSCCSLSAIAISHTHTLSARIRRWLASLIFFFAAASEFN